MGDAPSCVTRADRRLGVLGSFGLTKFGWRGIECSESLAAAHAVGVASIGEWAGIRPLTEGMRSRGWRAAGLQDVDRGQREGEW
jgi:hypothetical protein